MKQGKIITYILIMCSLIFCLPQLRVSAAGTLVPDHVSKITIDYKHDGKVLKNVEFSYVKVADVSDQVVFTFTSDFKNSEPSGVDLTKIQDTSLWKNYAKILSDYAKAKPLAMTTILTGNDGKFELSNLETGLYLFTCKDYVEGKTTIYSEPFLVAVPYSENGNWEYDVTVKPKTAITVKPDDPQPVPSPSSTPTPTPTPTEGVNSVYAIGGKVTTTKQWANDNETTRPASVHVELYGNDKLYSVKVVTAENNWTYTWEHLAENIVWKVVEKYVPDGYAPSYSTVVEEGKVIIVNTKISSNSIPQTGMVQWPIPLLAVAGSLLVFVGIIVIRKGKKGEV